MTNKQQSGLYNKFTVTRTDGTSEPGQKHENCEYFVLDVTHDKHSHAALKAYADSCEAEFPLLARDLRIQAKAQTIGQSAFFQKPTDTLLASLLVQPEQEQQKNEDGGTSLTEGDAVSVLVPTSQLPHDGDRD